MGSTTLIQILLVWNWKDSMYANKLRSEDDKKENIYNDMFHYIFINFH
jgi:hypothetical protein